VVCSVFLAAQASANGVQKSTKDYTFTVAPKDYTMTIIGEGTVSAVPNQIDIFITIEAFSKTSQQDAMFAQAGNTANVIRYLLQQGIDEKNIKTLSYAFRPKFEYDQSSRKQVQVGYVASQRMKVHTSQVRAGTIIDGVVSVGGATVNQVKFVVSNRKELMEAATVSAIHDAMDKAARRAKLLDVTLGSVVGYQEGSPSRPMMGRSMQMDMEAGATPMLPAGETGIRATVSVTFKIMNQ